LKIVIYGEEIDLENFIGENNGNDYLEVKKNLIKKVKQEVKQNPPEWEIVKYLKHFNNPRDSDLNWLIKNKKTGQLH